jgi:hypothetical protein
MVNRQADGGQHQSGSVLVSPNRCANIWWKDFFRLAETAYAVEGLGLTALFLVVLHPTELELGAPLGFHHRNSQALQVGSAFCYVKPKLVFYRAINALTAKQSVPEEVRRHGSNFLRTGAQDSGNGRGNPVPSIGLLAQALYTFARQPVILRAPIVFGNPPFRCEHALFFQPEKGRVQRALLHLERPSRDLLNSEQHTVSVQRPQRHCLQD